MSGHIYQGGRYKRSNQSVREWKHVKLLLTNVIKLYIYPSLKSLCMFIYVEINVPIHNDDKL